MPNVLYKIATSDNTDTTLTHVTGWSAQETAGTAGPAVLYLRNASTSGDKVIRIELTNNESANMSYEHPIMFPGKCIVNISSGTCEVTVFGF